MCVRPTAGHRAVCSNRHDGHVARYEARSRLTLLQLRTREGLQGPLDTGPGSSLPRVRVLERHSSPGTGVFCVMRLVAGQLSKPEQEYLDTPLLPGKVGELGILNPFSLRLVVMHIMRCGEHKQEPGRRSSANNERVTEECHDMAFRGGKVGRRRASGFHCSLVYPITSDERVGDRR